MGRAIVWRKGSDKASGVLDSGMSSLSYFPLAPGEGQAEVGRALAVHTVLYADLSTAVRRVDRQMPAGTACGAVRAVF
jgi:hypothetical protein